MLPIFTSPQVLVFKTNINSKNDAQKLKQVLRKKSILKWNVDLDDHAKVLRVVTAGKAIQPIEIIQVLKAKGLDCVELE